MKPTIGDVLSNLEIEGYIDADGIGQAEAILQKNQDETAWYIAGLMGCGGWMAAIFAFIFLGGLFFFALFDAGSGIVAIIAALILIGGVTVLRRAVDNLAVNQFALAYMITGQIFLMLGLIALTDGSDTLFPIYLVMLAVQLILLPLYPDITYRALSGMAVAGLLHTIAYELGIPYSGSVIGLVLAGLTTYIWGQFSSPKTIIELRPIIRPAAYALVVALIGTSIWELFASDWANYDDIQQLAAPPLSTLGYTLLVLLMVYRTLGRYNVPPTAPLALGTFGFVILFALPSFLAPGLMACFLLILLGYRNSNGTLLSLAYIGLVGFIGYFYYSLDTTLLIKSFIMMGSGIIMLGGWWLLREEIPAPPEPLQKEKAKS